MTPADRKPEKASYLCLCERDRGADPCTQTLRCPSSKWCCDAKLAADRKPAQDRHDVHQGRRGTAGRAADRTSSGTASAAVTADLAGSLSADVPEETWGDFAAMSSDDA